jgi:pimeloyl-ACP methyl ester carboxylesterase
MGTKLSRWNTTRSGPIGAVVFKWGFHTGLTSFAKYYALTGNYATDKQAYFAFPGTEPTVKLVYEDVQHHDLNTLLHYFNRMPDIDIAAWLPRIQAPTLVITGDSDEVVPPEQAHLIAAKVPHSTLVELKGAGHMAMMERPDEYTRTVTDWVLKYQ